MSGSAHSAALDLEAWLGTLKSWAAGVARRRRRPDLAEDIESAAVELMLARGQMGVVPDPEVERVIAAELELADNFSTARDSDLTAAANERFDRETVGSYLGELVSDGTSEDTMIALLDGEPREEGRDLEEIEDDLDQVMPLLWPREEKLFVLRNMLDLTWQEIGRHLRITPGYAFVLYQKAQKRTSSMLAVRDLLARAAAPDFTRLEVEWITL